MRIVLMIESGNGGRVFQPVHSSLRADTPAYGGQAREPVQSKTGSAALSVRVLIQWRVRKPALRCARDLSSRE